MARSTVDAELNSLFEGVYEELMPIHQLLAQLLGEKALKAKIREDNSAVVQAIRKGTVLNYVT